VKILENAVNTLTKFDIKLSGTFGIIRIRYYCAAEIGSFHLMRFHYYSCQSVRSLLLSQQKSNYIFNTCCISIPLHFFQHLPLINLNLKVPLKPKRRNLVCVGILTNRLKYTVTAYSFKCDLFPGKLSVTLEYQRLLRHQIVALCNSGV
jgi:hypothetical protein